MDLVRLTTRPIVEEQDKKDDIPPLIKVSRHKTLKQTKVNEISQVLISSHDYKERIEQCKQTVVAIAKRRKNFLDELK